MLTANSTVCLNNGREMPLVGLGVFQAREGEEVENAVTWALDAGYRSIDTAAVYQNERGVGEAVKASGVPREDIFLTTKVWNTDQGFDATLQAFDKSLDRMQTDFVDLYLIHWPVEDRFKETWAAMEYLHEQGRARSIGVSNFLVHHLKELLSVATVMPTVNQVEFHPRLQQPGLQDFCHSNEIVLEAWSPLMKGKVLEIPELVEIAEGHGKNAVQVTVRWLIQKGIIAIPKSVHRERIEKNIEVFDFQLSEEEMAAINALDRGTRIGPDPDNFNF